MTPEITITRATVEHARELAVNLRAEDKRELTCLGHDPHRLTRRAVRWSHAPKAVLLGGKVAALWGVGGNLLGGTGHPWLLLTDEAKRVSPFFFARFYLYNVKAMLEIFPHLVNYVDADYLDSIRMLKIAGFTVHPPAPFGKMGHMFRKFEIRRREDV
jgi:hypothetical protein